jgi:hypothetical protein
MNIAKENLILCHANKKINDFCLDIGLKKETSLRGEDVQALILFSSVGISNQNDMFLASDIFNILSRAHGRLNNQLFKQAYADAKNIQIKTAADLYQSILESHEKVFGIKKIAYPAGPSISEAELTPPVNIQEWGKITKEIYNASYSGQMDLDEAISIAKEKLNKRNSGEGDGFEKWINYYKNGEHQKYSSQKGDVMLKNASYQFNPRGTQQYNQTPDIREHSAIFDLFGDKEDDLGIFESNALDARSLSEKKNEYKTWKSKLHTAIRRIDKLIRNSEGLIEPELTEKLSEILHSFDLQVGRAKLHSTASDLTFKAAQGFQKLGFNEGSDILIKLAQQAPSPEEPIQADSVAPTPINAEQQLQEALPVSEPIAEGMPEGKANMFGKQFTLDDAVEKLDEVSNQLADRSVIRMLSEFDIILDSLGIASMFPELAEAQSKLIDGYSYALTRVTKMMGMIGSGRTISELAKEKQDALDAKAESLAERELEKGKEEKEEEQPSQAQKEFGKEQAPQAATPQQPAPTV